MREPGAPEIEATILRLLAARGAGRTICPSEAARSLAGDEAFRDLMHPVREVAYAMADRGALEVTQSGTAVDGREAKGPIRLRLPSHRETRQEG